MKSKHIGIFIVIMFQLFILGVTFTMMQPIRDYNSNFEQYNTHYEERFCPYCGQEYENIK